MNGTNGVKNIMTNYIEGFVGDENPIDIEVAIIVCSIRDQLRQGISPYLPRIHSSRCEYGDREVILAYTIPGAVERVTIKGVIEP